MKTKIIIVSLVYFSLVSSNLIYANNDISTINISSDLKNVNISNDLDINMDLNLIDKDMLDSEGNLIVPEIEIPDDLPDFNVSLRDKYDNALAGLKIQGFEVNNIVSSKPHNFSSDIENFFFTKFPDTKLTLESEIDELMYEFTSEFDEIYNGDKEELPSKEATLIWDMNKVLSGAEKPKGYEDALKEVNKGIGSPNKELKDQISNKIDSIQSNINTNAKPSTPNTPTTGTVSKPSGSTATKPSTPSLGNTTLKKPELTQPTVDKVSGVDLLKDTGTSILNTGKDIVDKVESGWDKIVNKVQSGWNKLTGK